MESFLQPGICFCDPDNGFVVGHYSFIIFLCRRIIGGNGSGSIFFRIPECESEGCGCDDRSCSQNSDDLFHK